MMKNLITLAVTIISFLVAASSIMPPVVPPPKAPTGRVTVAWYPEDADGFRIYSGPASSTYTNMVDAGNCVEIILVLPYGTNYLAATAYNIFGETAFSSELQVIVAAPQQPNQYVARYIIGLRYQTNLLGPATYLEVEGPAFTNQPQGFLQDLGLRIVRTNY